VAWRRLARVGREAGLDSEVLSLLAEATLSSSFDGLGCVLVPDPAGPGRPGEFEGAVGKRAAALGPLTSVDRVHQSWRLAKAGLGALESGAVPTGELLIAEDHLADLLFSRARS
jgi:hypothetical protein